MAERKIAAMRTVPVLLVLMVAACGGGEDAGDRSHPMTASPGREYVLGFGETLHVEGGLSLEFTTLAEDSRCPSNVTCVWAGNARILLTAISPRSTANVELNTSGQFPTNAQFESYSIALRKLDPYPLNGPAPAAGYEATLFVDTVIQPAGS